MHKGLNKTAESTSLLGEGYLKHSSNFQPTINGVEVRDGMAVLLEELKIGSNKFAIDSVASVNIGGVDMVLIITTIGEVKAFIPELVGELFNVTRRWYGANEQIILGTDPKISKSKIIVAGNHIYLISNRKTWAIKKDGLCYFGGTSMIVDALDATIYDVEDQSISLWRTGGYNSTIPQKTSIAYRVRNEFGGRGAMSQILPVAKDDSYVVAGLDGMRKDVFGIHNPRSFPTEILWWGVKFGTAMGVERYTSLSDSVYDFAGNDIGVLDNNAWTNGEVESTFAVTADGFYGVDIVMDRATIGDTSKLFDHLHYYMFDIAGTDTYSCLILISKDETAILVCDPTTAAKFTNQKIYYAPKVATNLIGTPGAVECVEKTADWAVKITSAAADFVNGADKGTLVVANTAGDFDLQFNSAAPDTFKYFNIDIQGNQELLNLLRGTRFKSTGQISWTTFIPKFAVDSSNNLCELVVFTKPFASIPETTDTSIDVESSFAGVPMNFWHRRDRLNDYPGYEDVHELELGIDIDAEGLFVYDKNFDTDFKNLVDASADPIYREPLAVFYSSRTSAECVIEEAKIDVKKFYDVYRIADKFDFWIGGSYTNVRNNLKQDDVVTNATLSYNWKETLPTVEPLLLSQMSIQAAGVVKDPIMAMGDWDDIVFFSDRFYAVLGGVIKVGNPFLEFDPRKTIAISGSVRELIPFINGIFVLTDRDVLKIDEKHVVSTFLDFPVEKALAVGNQIMFVAESGEVFLTSYKRHGAENVGQQAGEFNTTVEKISEIIIDVVENWRVYDIIYHNNNFYFSTSIGVYVFYTETKTWWRLDFPIESVLKFVNYKDRLLCYGGDLDNATWGSTEVVPS